MEVIHKLVKSQGNFMILLPVAIHMDALLRLGQSQLKGPLESDGAITSNIHGSLSQLLNFCIQLWEKFLLAM